VLLFVDSCPVMLVGGDYSPHLNDTVAMNGRLDPSNSTWMKVLFLKSYKLNVLMT